MEPAVNPEDLVDCILYLCNGNLLIQSVPKGILDWINEKQLAGYDNGFIIRVDETPYLCRDIFFRFFTNPMCVN